MRIFKILHIQRFILISPELFIGVIVLFTFVNWPEWFGVIANSIWKGSGLPSYIGALPFALVAASIKVGSSVLRPGSDEDENKIMYEWPLYWAIEARVYGSIIICGLCCVAVAIFYLNPMDWPANAMGAILVGSLSISVATAFLLLLAKMTLRKILTLHR